VGDAYGEDSLGGACCLYYCLVSPDGTLYVTTDMSSDMDISTAGWTRSSDEITTLFPDTLSPTDAARCERAFRHVDSNGAMTRICDT
jgi:hypothetical protein